MRIHNGYCYEIFARGFVVSGILFCRVEKPLPPRASVTKLTFSRLLYL